MKIKLFVVLPISFIFICAVISQYAALIYINTYSMNLQENLFQNQITFSKIFTQILSQQLNGEIMKFSQQVYLLNNYFSKVINGRVVFQEAHKYAFLQAQRMNERTEDPVLLSLYYQRPLLTNVWYHKNASHIEMLDEGGKEVLRNASRFYVLQKGLEYENQYLYRNNRRKLKFYNVYTGYEYQGMLTDSPLNLTIANLDTPGCGTGFYKYDPRCRYWYVGTIKYESQIFLPPTLGYSTTSPSIGSNVCQKLYKYNYTTNNRELYNVMCIDIQLDSIQDYFSNFVSSTKQFYFIDPRSQIILFNSNYIQDIHNITTTTLNQVELQHLSSQKDAKLLNDTINQNFTTWIRETVSGIHLNTSMILQSQEIQLPYNRNGTQTTVILTPVAIYEKIPRYEGYSHWVNNSSDKYYVEIPYLQINIISDQDLKVQAKIVEEFFKTFFMATCIVLGVSALISIIITIIYANRIRDMLNFSVDSLTNILRTLADKKVRDNIFALNSEEMLYSYETLQLYESFKGIYQILLSTSENFFSDNQTNTLLRLNKNIEFFKQFGNIEAVGITLNNIGSIFLSQHHYLQALESFSESVIYAKYQIKQFCEENPYSISAQLLAEYSFDDKFYLFLKEKPSEPVEIDRDSISIKKQRSSQFNSINNKIERNVSDQSNRQASIGKRSFQLSNFTNAQKSSYTFKTPINFSNKNTSAALQKQNGIGEMVSALFKKHFSERKISNKLQNYTSQKLIQYTQDLKMRLEQTKVGNEEFYEKRIELLQSLYFRKKNYLAALMAFQENNDYVKNQKLEKKENKMQKIENQFQSNMDNSQIYCQLNGVYSNFWKEIKQGLYELMVMVKYLPSWETQVIEIQTRIARCKFNLDQKEKSTKILKQCEHQLQQLQSEANKKENLLMNNVLTSKNIFQSEYQRNQMTPDNRVKDYSPHDINKKTQRRIDDNQFQEFSSFGKLTKGRNDSVDFRFQDRSIELSGTESVNFTNRQNLLQILTSKTNTNFQLNQYLQQLSPIKQKQTKENNIFSQQANPMKVFVLDGSHSISNQNSCKLLLNQSINNGSISQFNTPKLHPRKTNWFSNRSKRNSKKQLETQHEDDQKNEKNSKEEENSHIEDLFHHQRVINKFIKDDIALLNTFTINFQDMYIRFTNSELLLSDQKYVESAIELTALLEQKKYLISHLPFKIFHHLKYIFYKLNSPCKEINTIYKKFNPNLSFHVIMIISSSKDQKQLLKAVQLTSDLVSTTLVAKRDQLGVTVADHVEKQIVSYMIPTYVIQIKNRMNHIINSIIKITFKKQTLPSFGELWNLAQNLEQSEEEEEGGGRRKSNEELGELKSSQKELVKQSFECQSQNTKGIYHCDNEKEIDQLISTYKQKYVEPIPNIYECNLNETVLQNQQIQDQQISKDLQGLLQLTLKEEGSTPENKTRDFLYKPSLFNIQNTQKSYIVGGDCVEVVMKSTELIDTKSQISLNQIVDDSEDTLIQNSIFHLSLRKTLRELSTFSTFSQSEVVNLQTNSFLSKKILQKEEEKDEIEENQYEQILNSIDDDNTTLSIDQKRFIVFTTDRICIYKNHLFDQLCLTLFNLDIILIILTFNRSQHFLENSSDQTYVYKEKDVIKVFYSNRRIQSYIQNQRDRFSKFEYPTLIQHF